MDYKKPKMSMKVPITFLAIIALMIGFKVIYDNPNLLNIKKNEDKELTGKYIIETDSKYLTMQNDGGSYNSVYYEIDFNVKEIVKISEAYHANLNGTPTTDKNVVYTRKMDNEISKEISNLITKITEKEDTNPSDNYMPYIIKYNEEEKAIYNEATIKEIKEMLVKIDGDDIDSSNKELLFIVNSNNQKCPSPTLYVYSDNTYELYNTYSRNGKKIEPKTGEYNYNTNLILQNIGEFEDNGTKYIIEDSNNIKHGFNTYAYLEDFLNETNIKIDTCIEAE